MEFSEGAGDQGHKENALPTHFVVSRSPKEYLKQGKLYCGQYSAWGILSAYGLVNQDNPLNLSSPLGRISGLTTPQMMISILTKNGLEAEMKTVKNLTNEEQLTTLKEEVAKDRPVALLVNNGYKHKDGYSKFNQATTLHWVTVWGYDDKQQTFFLYDPAVKSEHHNKNIPTGNVAREYKQVLRDWKGWAFPLFERYRYITVKP